jgi:hypothetical protein
MDRISHVDYSPKTGPLLFAGRVGHACRVCPPVWVGFHDGRHQLDQPGVIPAENVLHVPEINNVRQVRAIPYHE